MKTNREYRTMELRLAPTENETEEKSYLVEGYASTFEPYVLFTSDGTDYSERIEPTAFEGADLSDVVLELTTKAQFTLAPLRVRWNCGRTNMGSVRKPI